MGSGGRPGLYLTPFFISSVTLGKLNSWSFCLHCEVGKIISSEDEMNRRENTCCIKACNCLFSSLDGDYRDGRVKLLLAFSHTSRRTAPKLW